MKILFIVSGMTPQIITETVYGLAISPENNEQWIPDRIEVLSTKFGITQIRGALLEQQKLQQLCQEYDLPAIEFSENNLHVLVDENGVALDDIKSKSDSELVANAICKKVREFTANDQTELHVSIAGGRKTMGYYAGYAMSLYGRAQDRMSHVLVSDRFEQVPDFFYPTRESHLITNRQGIHLDAKEAKVWLIDLPFVQLRKTLENNKILMNEDFSDVVFKTNVAQTNFKLTLDLSTKQVMINDEASLAVELAPVEFAFLYWFADMAKQNNPNNIQAPKIVMEFAGTEAKKQMVKQEYLDKFDGGLSLTFNQGYYERYQTSQFRSDDDLIDGGIILDKAQFEQIKARLKKSLINKLGLDLGNRLVPLAKKRGENVVLALEPENICIKDY